MSYQLVRLGADEAYKLLNECLGEIMEVRHSLNHDFDDKDKEIISKKLEIIEIQIKNAMSWIYGIKEL